MLNPSEFLDLEKGMNKASDITRRLVEQQGGVFKEKRKDKKRKVWYLDTRNHDIKNNNFLLRVRKEKQDEYKITLKSRHPDRYVAGLYNLSKPLGKDNIILDEFKFQEDIMPKFVSKFSASADLETNEKPEFDTYGHLLSLYPHLDDLGIASTEKLTKVNEFEVHEISCDLGGMKFGDDNDKAKVQIGLWYLSAESPIIVEFDIDLEAKDSSSDTSNKLEKFSPSLIIGIYNLFMSLQNEDIIDNSAPMTKTEFAYEYGKNS